MPDPLLELSSGLSADDFLSDDFTEFETQEDEVVGSSSGLSAADFSDDGSLVQSQPEPDVSFGDLAGQFVEGFTTRISSNVNPSARSAQVFEDISQEQGTLQEDVARGFGDAAGDLTTVGGFTAAGAGLGSVVPGLGTAVGAVGGGLVGSAVTIVQGVRSELNEVEDQVRARGGTDEQVRDAKLKAVGFIGIGEFTDFIPFVNLIPKKFRRAGARAVTDTAVDAASAGINKLGIVKGILTGAGAEALGEGIQTSGSTAAVRSETEDVGFGQALLEEQTSEQTNRARLVGGIVGGGVRGGIDTGVEVLARRRAEETGQTTDEERASTVNEQPTDEAALEVTAGIVELQDPDSDTNRVEIQSDAVSPEQLQQVAETEPGLEAEITDDGGLALIQTQQPQEVQDGDTQTDVTQQSPEGITTQEPVGLEAEAQTQVGETIASQEQGSEIVQGTPVRELALGEQDIVRDAQVLNEANQEQQAAVEEFAANNDPQSQPQPVTNLEVPVETRPRDFQGELAITNIDQPAQDVTQATTGQEAAQVFDTNTERSTQRPVTREQQASVVPSDSERKLPNAIGAASILEFQERRESQRIREEGTQEPEVQAIFGESRYIPIRDADTVQEVNQKIEQNGLIESAADAINGTFSPQLLGKQKVVFANEVRNQLNEQVRIARAAQDLDSLDFFASMAADVSHVIAELGTEAGQQLQAFSQYANAPREVILKSIDKIRRQEADRAGREFTALPDETLARISELSDQIEQLPADSVFSRELHRQLLAEVARADGVSPADVITAMWYANILSGPNTQAINIFGNGVNLFLRTLGTGLTNDPRVTVRMLQGIAEGSRQGAREARAALEGKDISRSLERIQAPGALENTDSIARWGRFVFRALAAGDGYFYRTAKEGRAYLAAAQAAKQDSRANDTDFSQNIANILHNSDNEVSDARIQAEQEAKIVGNENENDILRRTYEILEQRRPEQVRTESDRFGAFATYTNPPDGLMGHIARGINKMVDGAVIQTTAGDFKVLKPVVPFVNIVANVASGALDFTPIGLARFVRGGKIVGNDGRYQSLQEKYDALGNFIVGAAATALLFQFAEDELENEDPFFAVYGEGPENIPQRRQLQSQGWKPFSIKIGDKFVRYNETPLALMFATVGGYHDGIRYKDFRASTESLAFGLQRASKAFLDAGFLKGVSNVFEVMNGKRRPASFAAGVGRGFIPAQGLLRDTGRIFDPTLVDTRTGTIEQNAWASIIKGVPYAQQLGTRPMLNALGQPIELDPLSRTPLVSRFLSQRNDDPNWQWLAENAYTMPGLQGKVKIGAGQGRRQRQQVAEAQEERLQRLGKMYFDTFTPDEHYEFIEKQGEKVRGIIEELRQSDLPREEIQDELDRRIKNARKETKLEMLGIDLPRRRRRRRRRRSDG